jgi:phytoene/squalene synthetase
MQTRANGRQPQYVPQLPRVAGGEQPAGRLAPRLPAQVEGAIVHRHQDLHARLVKRLDRMGWVVVVAVFLI